MKVTCHDLNQASEERFVAWLGPVYENSPWVARRAFAARPFRNREELWGRMQDVVNEASVGEILDLIRAHPDLVGRAAREGSLTPTSHKEQEGAGLTDLSREEVGLFEQYNREYQARFSFPFVICARENKKESILSAFPQRLTNTREEEMETALREIGKIARFRIHDLVSE